MNDNLNEWGTTPSFEDIKKAADCSKDHDIPLIVMNRPRGGNFCYSNDEKEIIWMNLEGIIKAGATFESLLMAGKTAATF